MLSSYFPLAARAGPRLGGGGGVVFTRSWATLGARSSRRVGGVGVDTGVGTGVGAGVTTA